MQFNIGGSVRFGMNVTASGGRDEEAVHSKTVRNMFACTREEYSEMEAAGTLDPAGIYLIVRQTGKSASDETIPEGFNDKSAVHSSSVSKVIPRVKYVEALTAEEYSELESFDPNTAYIIHGNEEENG
jgi:hypothetical protein